MASYFLADMQGDDIISADNNQNIIVRLMYI
jgi:hypothetical protein